MGMEKGEREQALKSGPLETPGRSTDRGRESERERWSDRERERGERDGFPGQENGQGATLVNSRS